MWFAIVSCLLCGALVLYSRRTVRKIRAAEPVERVRHELSGGHVAAAGAAEDELRLRALVQTVQRAQHRAEAVAALNEFILEAQAEGEREVELPGLLARVCFTLGLLFGVLALTETLGAPDALAPDLAAAAVAMGAGLLGGMVCYSIGHKAKQRRRAYREQVRLLSKILQNRLPPDGSAVGSQT